MPYFGGLDWGAAGHAVCVVDSAGAVVFRLEVTHDAAGLGELRKRLAKLASAGDIPIAIARPSGLIVDVLVDVVAEVVEEVAGDADGGGGVGLADVQFAVDGGGEVVDVCVEVCGVCGDAGL